MAECPVARLKGQVSPEQAEVVELVVDDREGYTDELAAQCLGSLRTAPDVTEGAVHQHRAGKCGCVVNKEPKRG